MGLYDYTLYSVVKRSANADGNRVAFISGEERITYRQFLEKVDRLACGLSRIGLKRGDRIGILALNSLEFICLYGAAAKTILILCDHAGCFSGITLAASCPLARAANRSPSSCHASFISGW